MAKIVKGIVIALCIFLWSAPALFAQGAGFKNIEVLMLKGAYAQAARACRKILAHHHRRTTRAKAYYLLGVCLLKEDKFAQARQNFQKVRRRYPSSKFSDDAALALAHSYYLAGDYSQAESIYQDFLAEFTHSELRSIARQYLELCNNGAAYRESHFSVQVGCFNQRKNAQNLRDDLIHHGYQAYILKRPKEAVYRVRVGKFSHRRAAKSLEQRLKRAGYSTKICP